MITQNLDLDKIQNIGLPTFSYRSGGRTNADIGRVISDLLPYLFGAAGIILIFMIISSGFSMMTSRGDPKVFQMAQGKLTTAVLGVFILFISFFVVQLVLKFFGINTTIFG